MGGRSVGANPTKSIPVIRGGWAETKAAYRLLDNDVLDWPALLETQREPTVERMAGQERGLCLQNTTELNFRPA
jgi:hypothetical protein